MLPSRKEPEHKSMLIVADERSQEERDRALVALLDSWMDASEEEKQEQRETWEYLRRVLDEDRLGYRKLFP